MERPGGHRLHQVILHGHNEENWHHTAPDVAPWQGHNITCVVFLLKMYNLTRVMGKQQTNLNWEKFYKTMSLCFSKNFNIKKDKKVEDLFHIQGDWSHIRITCTRSSWTGSWTKKLYEEHYWAAHIRLFQC